VYIPWKITRLEAGTHPRPGRGRVFNVVSDDAAKSGLELVEEGSGSLVLTRCTAGFPPCFCLLDRKAALIFREMLRPGAHHRGQSWGQSLCPASNLCPDMLQKKRSEEGTHEAQLFVRDQHAAATVDRSFGVPRRGRQSSCRKKERMTGERGVRVQFSHDPGRGPPRRDCGCLLRKWCTTGRNQTKAHLEVGSRGELESECEQDGHGHSRRQGPDFDTSCRNIANISETWMLPYPILAKILDKGGHKPGGRRKRKEGHFFLLFRARTD